mmetsp:Transcript_29543/g.65430  ORF Transcript_29543/g.65430 Transcript_29543/m.65430 type:complete len:220 (-) Transcript_29543:273-932(-)
MHGLVDASTHPGAHTRHHASSTLGHTSQHNPGTTAVYSLTPSHHSKLLHFPRHTSQYLTSPCKRLCKQFLNDKCPPHLATNNNKLAHIPIHMQHPCQLVSCKTPLQPHTLTTMLKMLRGVEDERHPLQGPQAGVLTSRQVRLKHKAHTHGVTPRLRHVDRRPERVGQLELVGLNGDDLQDGQLRDQHLGVLLAQHAALQVPAGPLQVQTAHIAAVPRLL